MALTKIKGSILSDEIYRRENNLNDVLDKAIARNNLSVYSKAEIYSKNENYSKGEVYSKNESDSRFLNESSNLSDLENITTARTNLSIYSKAEVDAKNKDISDKITELNNVISYVSLDFGIVSSHSRYVQANPFGIDATVIVQAQLFHNNKWANVTNFFEGSLGYGASVSAVPGEGIVVKTASGPALRSDYGVNCHDINSYKDNVPCKVHVWRVKG